MRELILAFALLTGSAGAVAGELDSRTIRTFNEWNPDGCYKPSQPSFFVHDDFSQSMAVNEYNSYVQELRSYLSCVMSEAASDASTFDRMLDDSVSRLKNEAVSEADDARSDLESAILLR